MTWFVKFLKIVVQNLPRGCWSYYARVVSSVFSELIINQLIIKLMIYLIFA